MNKYVKYGLIALGIYAGYKFITKKPALDDTHLDRPTLLQKIMELGKFNVAELEAKTDQQLLDLYNSLRPGK